MSAQQILMSRGCRLLISALIAGVLAGVGAYAGGSTQKASVLLGAVLFLKDMQAYLSTAPGDGR
jgi:hypothetical protein